MSRVFDGSQLNANGTYLITPAASAYNNLNAFTYSVWVNPSGLGHSNDGTIFVKDATTNYSPFLQFNANGTATLLALVEGSISPAETTPNNLLSLNTWTNVVMTFDINGDKKIHLYYGGTEVSYSQQTTIGGTLADDSAHGYTIGNDTDPVTPFYPNDGWTGAIAEFAIWNKVLTQGQITTLSASTTGASAVQTPNLVAYWHLCGLVSPELDIINGNNAVLSPNPPITGSNSPGFSGCSSSPSVPWVDPNINLHITYAPLADSKNVINYSGQSSSHNSPGTWAASGNVPTATINEPDNKVGSNSVVTPNEGSGVVLSTVTENGLVQKTVKGRFDKSTVINNPA